MSIATATILNTGADSHSGDMTAEFVDNSVPKAREFTDNECIAFCRNAAMESGLNIYSFDVREISIARHH